eukprot:1980722-Pyramimonas_sp.AAC.1
MRSGKSGEHLAALGTPRYHNFYMCSFWGPSWSYSLHSYVEAASNARRQRSNWSRTSDELESR